ALKVHPQLRLRMGIHSGPVTGLTDVNDRSNVAGAGINTAQRVMDCGDAGHILLSQRLADDLAHDGEWTPYLHDLGEVEVKHGVRVAISNLYGQDFGNSTKPEALRRAEKERAFAKRRRVVFTIAAVFVLIFGLGIGTWVWQRRAALTSAYKAGAAGVTEKSVAVLPFENLSDEKQNGFLTDGVQNEILTDLAKIADLKVISRSSVMAYKAGTPRNLREIGQQLGVAHVLEGGVQRAGGKVRVNAQLIDARTDAHLWARSYDRDIANVFA